MDIIIKTDRKDNLTKALRIAIRIKRSMDDVASVFLIRGDVPIEVSMNDTEKSLFEALRKSNDTL